MNIQSGYVIIPILINVVVRPTCCSVNPEHKEGILLNRGGIEIMLGCKDCLDEKEFNIRALQSIGLIQ
jgi:hypothetical protein